MIALLLRLYPATWRRRYGDEFAAVLEERPLGPFDVADVLLGALDAHLHRRGLWTESGPRKAISMTLRIGGLAAILFGLIWTFGIGWASCDDSDEDLTPMILTIVGDVALIVALIGLSAFQARQHPRVVWGSVVLPVVGAVLAAVGTVLMVLQTNGSYWPWVSAWGVWILGVVGMMLGSILFAVATWNTKALAGGAAALVGIGSVVAMVSGFGGILVGVVLGFAVLSIGWIWLSVDAIRRDRSLVSSVLP